VRQCKAKYIRILVQEMAIKGCKTEEQVVEFVSSKAYLIHRPFTGYQNWEFPSCQYILKKIRKYLRVNL
jgi:hypothetical protein